MDGSNEKTATTRTATGNARIVIACSLFVVSMTGMAYAAVPLYQIFCQVTGYGGTTQRVDQASDTILDQTIRVRFDANVNGLNWGFRPKQREVEVRIGETVQVAYEAENRASSARSGQATFNVTPLAAGAYFNKVDCFCFTEQRLEAGERVDMPIVFFVDPAIVDVPEMEGVNTITLSYTFYPRESEAPLAEAPLSDDADAQRL